MGERRRALIAAAVLLALAGEGFAQRPQRRPVTEEERQAAIAALERFTSATLTRFGSDAEFRRYVDAAREVWRTRYDYYYDYSSARARLQFAQAQVAAPVQSVTQSDAPAPVCDPELGPCPEPDDLDSLPQAEQSITVTGSRINPRNPSITNNQMRGVEEGDIVKQIDHYLLVLQDGRIFVIDMNSRGRRLALTDRTDVYRNPRSGIWYDEMLVFGDRVLITGYSYEEGASELAVFRLVEGGRLLREGVFRMSSNDYYDSSNYATRLIDGNLVVYTPLSVHDVARAGFKWPVIRRWLPEDDAREIADEAAAEDWRGPPLIDAASIYRPVRATQDPTIHTVSVCPLASAAANGDLSCRSTAFVGPNSVQWYVTNRDVYLWTGPEEGASWDRTREECPQGDGMAVADTAPALLYRIPHSGDRPALTAAHGFPPDQFAMQADERNFYALLRMEPLACRDSWDAPARLNFFSFPLDRLGPTVAEAPETSFTPLPATPSRWVASRFTDRHLVYGGLSQYRTGFPDLDGYGYDEEYLQIVRSRLRPRPAYVVPVERPAAVRGLQIGHTVIRAERIADDIVLTGYRDRGGLIVTYIDLKGPARVASSVRLAGRYESEGRSHAFNSLIEEDGYGLMGLPTVRRVSESRREWWRSRASDLSFLEVDPDGRLSPIGELERRFEYVDDYDPATGIDDEDGVPGYQCEVSCIDWYGNSRPIFTDGRIFGLSGTELIEGRIDQGRIREVQRLNIALESVRQRRASR